MKFQTIRDTPAFRQLKPTLIRFFSRTRLRRTGIGHKTQFNRALLYGVKLVISGRNNRLVIGPGTRIWGGSIRLTGENLVCEIGADCQYREVNLVVEDGDSRLQIGDGCSGTRCTIHCGEGRLVSLGRDCMVAAYADIRNTDAHSIVDLESGRRINPPVDTLLGDHVWVGLRACVLKGSVIGAHSIIGAGSVVTGNIPDRVIAGGVPARELRGGVTWTRTRVKTPATADVECGHDFTSETGNLSLPLD